MLQHAEEHENTYHGHVIKTKKIYILHYFYIIIGVTYRVLTLPSSNTTNLKDDYHMFTIRNIINLR